MCLVEVNKGLVVSRAVSLMKSMSIFTESKRVKYGRESVLEFLSVNHPLDCPICDQAGECDSQDISLIFGTDKGRFYEKKKRAVDNFLFSGALIKTIMTRCIHRTRCVRFINEISTTQNLGVLSRGSSMEIGTYIVNNSFDALSANIIDLCPVGALTSMPYAFSARPWELFSCDTIDVMDSLGAAIRVDFSYNKIFRILPRLEETVNEDWITNKARFVFDALTNQRLYYPQIRFNNKLVNISWYNICMLFLNLINYLEYFSIQLFMGKFVDLLSGISFKGFFNNIGCANIFYSGEKFSVIDFRSTYLLNLTIQAFEEVSLIVLFCTNLRMEVPLLNSRLRKNYDYVSGKNLLIYSLGLGLDYQNIPIKNIGNYYFELIKGKILVFNKIFSEIFSLVFLKKLDRKKNFKSLFLIGESVYSELNVKSIFRSFFLNNFFNNFVLNVIPTFLGKITCNEFAYNSAKNKSDVSNKLNFYYLCGVDIIPKIGNCLYQGFFKNWGNFFSKINLILPSLTYLEQNALYLNLEGKIKFNKKVLVSSKIKYSDWEILQYINLNKLNFKNWNLVKIASFKLFEKISLFINYFCDFFFSFESSKPILYKKGVFFELMHFELIKHFFKKTFCNKFIDSNLNRRINNYYSTDILSQYSKTLSICAANFPIISFEKCI